MKEKLINYLLVLNCFSVFYINSQADITQDVCIKSPCQSMNEILETLKKIGFKKEEEIIRVLSNLDNVAQLSTEINKYILLCNSTNNRKLAEEITSNLIEDLSGDTKNFNKKVMLATDFGAKSWIREQLKNQTTRQELESYLFTDNFDTIKLLLNVGINPNVTNSSGKTPLQNAIKKLDLKLIQLLLQNHADANAKNKPDDLVWAREPKTPPLVLAIKNLKSQLVKDINLDNLVIDKYANLVELLLKYGADIKLKDSTGSTAISAAKDILTEIKWAKIVNPKWDPQNVKKAKIEKLINILVKHGAKK